MNKAWISLGIAIASLSIGIDASRAENPDQVRQLLQTNNCEGCDLSNATLSGLNLSDANLRGANLEGANLSGTTLSRANLQQASLKDATITNAEFTGASLTDATLAGAKNVGLCQNNIFSRFGGGSQESTCLVLTLLSTFGPEELCKAEYGLTDLKMGNEFCQTLGNESFVPGAFLTVGLKSFFKVTSFFGADLTNTDLQSVDLTGADFRYANLTNANVQDATLDQAVLINANTQTLPPQKLSNTVVMTADVKTLVEGAIAREEEALRKRRGLSDMQTLLRAQRTYKFENDRFSNNIDELNAFLQAQDDYTYAVVPQADSTQRVVMTAISQASDLKSYVGVLTQDGDDSTQLICETIEPSQTLPPFDFSTNLETCPAGTQESE